MLPDDVLLEIFHIYVIEGPSAFEGFRCLSEFGVNQGWITLAHLCRRWRSVVFQSQRRLDLRLLCTYKTPARDTLDVWPPLPLIIQDPYGIPYHWNDTSGADNIIAALEHNDRVCQIDLCRLTSSPLEYVAGSAAMQKPFPELIHLRLEMYEYGPKPILPDSFLGGTAPRLQSLILDGISFPRLPKLLLSATHLVDLSLPNIPRSGYFPPDAMATSLSAMTSLESLRLNFRYPRPRPALENRRPPPPPLTRFILPHLTKIQFKGVSEYLEEILARIDAPRLDELEITFFNQIIFDTPQLFQFISRRPTLRAPERGRIKFGPGAIYVGFLSQTSQYDIVLSVGILCTTSEWRLSSLEQICTSSLPPLSTLEVLYIHGDGRHLPHWQDDFDNTLWLDLLRSFVAVKSLYLTKKSVSHIAPALQELVGGRTAEVLPTLENIFLEGFQPSGPLYEGIEKFVVARQLTSHRSPCNRFSLGSLARARLLERDMIRNYPSLSVSLLYM